MGLLTNPRFAGDSDLEQIAAGAAFMALGWFGCSVERVQIALEDLGFGLPTFGADGDFGAETKAAVQAFQSTFGLGADGVVGPISMGTLDRSSFPVPSREPSCGPPVGDIDPGGQGPGTTLLVRVVGPQGEPLGGATVDVVGPEQRSGPTNELGSVRFPGLLAGNYIVAGRRNGFADESLTVGVFETITVVLQLTTRVGTPPAVFELLPVVATSSEIGFITLPFDVLNRPQIQDATRATAIGEADAKLAGLVEQERRRHETETPDTPVTSRFVDRNVVLDEETTIEATEGSVVVEGFRVTATITAVIECSA